MINFIKPKPVHSKMFEELYEIVDKTHKTPATCRTPVA